MIKKEQSWKDWAINNTSSIALPYVNLMNRVIQNYIIANQEKREQVEQQKEANKDYNDYFDEYKEESYVNEANKDLNEESSKEKVREKIQDNKKIQIVRKENQSENRFVLVIGNFVNNISKALGKQNNKNKEKIKNEYARSLKEKYSIENKVPEALKIEDSRNLNSLGDIKSEDLDVIISVPESNDENSNQEKVDILTDLAKQIILIDNDMRIVNDKKENNGVEKEKSKIEDKKIKTKKKSNFVIKALCCGGKKQHIE